MKYDFSVFQTLLVMFYFIKCSLTCIKENTYNKTNLENEFSFSPTRLSANEKDRKLVLLMNV